MTLSAVSVAITFWIIVIAIVDGVYRKVPNLWLLLMLVPAVLAIAVERHGLLGVDLVHSGLGLVITSLILLPGYATGQMGAGDVKLGAVLGLLSGFPAALSWLFYAAMILGAMALVALVVRKLAGVPWKKIPAAVAMAAGFLGYLYFGGIRLGAG